MNTESINQGKSENIAHRIKAGMLTTPSSISYTSLKEKSIIEMKLNGEYIINEDNNIKASIIGKPSLLGKEEMKFILKKFK
tara:strand:- start:401 stop:643 length:243 start_codon:yes stop_codon:yes gene_type:complete